MNITFQRSINDQSRIFDVVQRPDGYYAFLINRSLYIKSDDMSPAMVDFYRVKDKDTYTGISYMYYGTIELWWLVCKMNEIVNPFEPMVNGVVLKLLKPEFLAAIVRPAIDEAEASYANSNVN